MQLLAGYLHTYKHSYKGDTLDRPRTATDLASCVAVANATYLKLKKKKRTFI